MQLLKDRILKDGIVKPGNILKVDSFLNHQKSVKSSKPVSQTAPSPRSLPSRPPASESPVSRHSISMFPLFLQKKPRA